MEIKLGDVVNGWESIQALSRTKFPAALSFRLARAMRSLSPVLEDYEKQRLELIKKHGRERDGGGWEIPDDEPEARSAYVEELEALLDEPVTVNVKQIPERAILEVNGDVAVEPGAIVGAWFLFEDD